MIDIYLLIYYLFIHLFKKEKEKRKKKRILFTFNDEFNGCKRSTNELFEWLFYFILFLLIISIIP